VLAGRDLLGCAQTGTGKTAAFTLPILQHLAEKPRGPSPAGSGRRPIRCLVLTPTRELAAQIGESFGTYGKFIPQHRVQGVPRKPIRHTVIFGGVGQRPQEDALRVGVDVVIATPGRLLDLASQRHLAFERLEIFVLDEADRMLDMGFLPDVRRVIALLPRQRQTLFFSATMPPDIRALADSILVDPVRVAVAPPATTVELIEQSVFFVEKGDKRALLEHVLGDPAITRVLVFTRTKHGANKVVQNLARANIPAEAIHGNKSQGARERALANFKRGATRVLVATDIAARGIDVEGISHVVNYDIPEVPETYVHRIGRTARAGASGIALSFCDAEERASLRDIERLTRQAIPVVADHPYRSSIPVGTAPRPATPVPLPSQRQAPRPGHEHRDGARRPSGRRRPRRRGGRARRSARRRPRP
jgi:ATP-dependent RNA helicase RhlE